MYRTATKVYRRRLELQGSFPLLLEALRVRRHVRLLSDRLAAGHLRRVERLVVAAVGMRVLWRVVRCVCMRMVLRVMLRR